MENMFHQQGVCVMAWLPREEEASSTSSSRWNSSHCSRSRWSTSASRSMCPAPSGKAACWKKSATRTTSDVHPEFPSLRMTSTSAVIYQYFTVISDKLIDMGPSTGKFTAL